LLLLGDCAFYNNNPELAAMYGIKFIQECLFAPIPDLNGTLNLDQFSVHQAVSGISQMTVNWGQSLGIFERAERLVSTGVDT